MIQADRPFYYPKSKNNLLNAIDDKITKQSCFVLEYWTSKNQNYHLKVFLSSLNEINKDTILDIRPNLNGNEMGKIDFCVKDFIALEGEDLNLSFSLDSDFYDYSVNEFALRITPYESTDLSWSIEEEAQSFLHGWQDTDLIGIKMEWNNPILNPEYFRFGDKIIFNGKFEIISISYNETKNFQSTKSQSCS
jgi:hypothetical protein